MDETFPIQKGIFFLFSTREEMRSFPDEVRREAGFQLDRVQRGLAPRSFDALPEIGSGVMEIKIDEGGDTYRVVYVAKFEEAVYILDAFQKKSPRGKRLPKDVRERLVQRYRYVREHRPARGSSQAP